MHNHIEIRLYDVNLTAINRIYRFSVDIDTNDLFLA